RGRERLWAQRFQDRAWAPGRCSRSNAGSARHAAVAVGQKGALTMPKITRRALLQSTAAVGLAQTPRGAERTAAPAPPADARKAYIGAPTSRIDGPAKVTGAAKYAAEF